MKAHGGSWAGGPPGEVLGVGADWQGGARRQWDILDGLRVEWLRHGYFQLYGAKVFIPPKGGKVHLARGNWKATISG